MRWTDRTTRFVCDRCGLRFSIDLKQMADTLRSPKRTGAFEDIGESMGFTFTLAQKAVLGEGGAEWLGGYVEAWRVVKPPSAAAKKARRVVTPRAQKRGRDADTSGPMTTSE